MTRPDFKQIAIRFSSGLGYGFCVLQWLWGIVLYLPILLDSDLFRTVTERSATQKQPSLGGFEFAETSVVGFLLAAIITMTFIAVAIIVVAKLPATIGRGIDAATHRTANATLHLITQHRKITPNKRRQLSKRLLNLVTFALCLIPLIAGLMSPVFTSELPRDVVYTVTAFLASGALLLLLPQAFDKG